MLLMRKVVEPAPEDSQCFSEKPAAGVAFVSVIDIVKSKLQKYDLNFSY